MIRLLEKFSPSSTIAVIGLLVLSGGLSIVAAVAVCSMVVAVYQLAFEKKEKLTDDESGD